MTLRSLHVITTDARRGAETFAVELAAALDAGGDTARVVALSPSRQAQAHAVRALGRSRRDPRTLAGLRRAAAGADVVVAHGSATLEACVVALAGRGVPVVYRTIGDPGYWTADAKRRTAVGLLLRRTRRVVALWRGAAEQVAALHRVPADRIDVIPNAVPAERFTVADAARRQQARHRLGVADGARCLAFVGALSTEKRVGAAIAAAHALAAVLLVAGDGPERAALAQQATAGDGDVRFLGAVDDPGDVYAAADLLVLPSRSEGMPGVVIEAGLVGTPVVATAVGALPDMIEDGVTGFLLPADATGHLADRIHDALPEVAAAGHAAARTFGERYTLDDVAPRWAATLARAAGR